MRFIVCMSLMLTLTAGTILYMFGQLSRQDDIKALEKRVELSEADFGRAMEIASNH